MRRFWSALEHGPSVLEPAGHRAAVSQPLFCGLVWKAGAGLLLSMCVHMRVDCCGRGGGGPPGIGTHCQPGLPFLPWGVGPTPGDWRVPGLAASPVSLRQVGSAWESWSEGDPFK